MHNRVRVFKSNQVFGKSNTWMNTKHSKTNRLQKTIEYRKNEKSAKYSN